MSRHRWMFPWLWDRAWNDGYDSGISRGIKVLEGLLLDRYLGNIPRTKVAAAVAELKQELRSP